MSNKISKHSVAWTLNAMINDTEDAMKAEVNSITLAEGASLEIKNSLGFTMFEFKENGDLEIKGSVIPV